MKPTILVPFDFGPPAHAALRWAADLQKSTGAGPLHVIHAVSALTVAPSDLPVGTLLPTEDEMKEFEKNRSLPSLRRPAFGSRERLSSSKEIRWQPSKAR